MAIYEIEDEQECLLDRFPNEILTKIFSYLSIKELHCSLRVVCRRWFNLIRYEKSLSSKLTAKDIKDLIEISPSALSHFMHFNSLSLKYLILDRWDDIPGQVLLSIASLVPRLRALSLACCVQVNEPILKGFSDNCQEITALDLEGCEEITDNCLRLFGGHDLLKLNVSHCKHLTDDTLVFISNTFQNIRNLNLDGVEWITDMAVDLLLQNCKNTLQELWLDGEKLTDFALTNLSSCCYLRTLKISYCEQLTDLTLSIICHLDSLKSLTLRKGKNFSNEGILSMFQTLKTGLLYLEFTDCQNLNDHVVQCLTQCSPDLISLDLSWCWEVTDEGLGHIVRGCRRMEKLTLTGLYNLTGVPFKDTAEKLPRLKYLDLQSCDYIQDDILREVTRQLHSLTVLGYYGCLLK